MKVEDIRLANLKVLVAEAGTAAALAHAAKTNPSYISQILTRAPSRTGKPRDVGSELARRLESACKKPEGWMDKIHDEQKPRSDTPPAPSRKGELGIVDAYQSRPYQPSTSLQHPADIEAPYLRGVIPIPDPIDADLLTRLFNALQRAAIATGEPADFNFLMRGACMAYPIYRGKRFDDDDLVRHYVEAIEARRAR